MLPLTCCICPCVAPATTPPPPPWRSIKELSEAEADVDAKMGLRRLLRGLQGCDAEVERYNAVLGAFLGAGEEEWEAVVAVYRGDLQKPFFEHMQVGAGPVGGGVGGCPCWQQPSGLHVCRAMCHVCAPVRVQPYDVMMCLTSAVGKVFFPVQGSQKGWSPSHC